jgi:hypothetical protein
VLAFFATSGDPAVRLELDNSMDVYWVVPLLYYSALPTGGILYALVQRFAPGPVKTGLVDTNKNFVGATGKAKGRRSTGRLATRLEEDALIEVAVLSGHLNNHPVGLTVLHRLMGLSEDKFKMYSTYATHQFVDYMY